jgi:hypothetical protein
LHLFSPLLLSEEECLKGEVVILLNQDWRKNSKKKFTYTTDFART